MRELEKLEYHKKWLEYGFLNEGELTIQIIEFDKGEDVNTEHYRYSSFLNYLEKREKFTNIEIDNFIELVALDTDQAMAGSALCHLFTSKKLTTQQVNKIEQELIKFGPWAEKIVERSRLKGK